MQDHIQSTEDTGKKQMESIDYLYILYACGQVSGGYVGLFGG